MLSSSSEQPSSGFHKPALLWIKSRMPIAVRDGSSQVTLGLAGCLREIFDVDLLTIRITGTEDSLSATITPPFRRVYIVSPDNAGGIFRRAAYRAMYSVRAILAGIPRGVFYSTGRHMRKRVLELLSTHSYSAVVFEYYTSAPLLRLPTCPTALLLHDATFKSLEYSIATKRGAAVWLAQRDAAVMKRFELQAINDAGHNLFISPRDISLFREAGSTKPMQYVPVVYPRLPATEVRPGRLYANSSPSICFMGSLLYKENRMAYLWFLKDVFPLVRQHIPAASLTVIGSGHETLPEKFQAAEGVTYLGWVEDLASTLPTFSVGIAPSVSGTGVKIKVLDMMWHGLPVVATTIASAGTPAENGAALVADDAHEFASHVVSLLVDPKKRSDLQKRAWECLELDHCGQMSRERVQEIFRAISRVGTAD